MLLIEENMPVEDSKETFFFSVLMEEYNFKICITKFYIFLTVHLRIILVSDQLDAQFLL